jgi:CDP-glucose 4,6-dehydratase
VTVVRGDVCDQALLERALGEHEIETVLHLAAQTAAPVADRNPVSTLTTNIAGTWTVLEACRRSPAVQQIVLTSSDKAYGDAAEQPCRETTPLRGARPYDVSKSCADLVARAYAATYRSPVIISRFAKLYGGGDVDWSRAVPGTIRSVLRGERPVIRGDGSHVRDYLHVEDAAAACVLLAEQLGARPELAGEAFNFSSEEPASVRAVVERIIALMGARLEPEILGEPSTDDLVKHISSEKARRVLGWAPRFTLDEGLRRTITWYRGLFAMEEAA